MKVAKWRIESDCQQVRFFPIVKKNKITGKMDKMRFGRLGFICLKFNIGNGKTSLTLGCSFAKGLDSPVYTIQHEPNPISGKPGMRERYDYEPEFRKRLAKFAGEDLAHTAINLFNYTAKDLAGELEPKKKKPK
jgi:hypothetical protein